DTSATVRASSVDAACGLRRRSRRTPVVHWRESSLARGHAYHRHPRGPPRRRCRCGEVLHRRVRRRVTTTRRCESTGLRLIASPGILGYHVGKLEYPALSAAPRDLEASAPTAWNRYDVVGGQTFYIAEKPECAYAEVLSQYKRANGVADPLSKDAAFFGMTLEEYVEEIAREWSELDFMGLGAVPAGWRFDRGM